MANQIFILHHIISEFENKLKALDWCGLEVHVNEDVKNDSSVSLNLRTYDIDVNIYQNLNDTVKVGNKLVPRSLPVDSHLVVFFSSESHENLLKAMGVLLQEIRENRKLEVGDYDWLTNEKAPMTIDSVEAPDIGTKIRIKEHMGFKDALPLFFKVRSFIDSKVGQEFVVVEERKVHMEKINEK